VEECLFDTPCGFAGLVVVGLLAIFRFSFDRTSRFEGFVDAVVVRSLDTLGTGYSIRLLLCGTARLGGGEGCGSTVSTPEDNGKISTFNRRWGPFLLPVAFENFDEWTGPRDAFVGCPFVGRRTREWTTVQRYHILIQLNQYLQMVLVEINPRCQTPGSDLIQREMETQKYIWQVLLLLYGWRS